MRKPISHSYSAEDMYLQCQKKYHEVRVLKKWPYKQSEEALFGDQQHALAEKALQNDTQLGGPLGKAMEFVRGFTGLKLAETKLTLNNKLKPTGYFAKDAWYRLIVDVTILNGTHCVVVDYKTGKRRVPWELRDVPNAKPADTQMLRYALAIMLYYPQIETVEAYIYYTHNGHAPDRYDFHRRDDAARMLQGIREVTGVIEKKAALGDRGVWAANDTPLCGWCDVIDCEYWRKPRDRS